MTALVAKQPQTSILPPSAAPALEGRGPTPIDLLPAVRVPTAEEEQKRLDAVARYDILDTRREEGFDRIARLIRNIFGVPIAVVSVIDAHRQWYKAEEGLGVSETSRQDTFCQYALTDPEPLIVADASKDGRFDRNPSVVGETGVRFYAGVPLQTDDGYTIGTLCAIDTTPRILSAREIEILRDLARLAMEEIELRRLATRDGLTGCLTRLAFKEQGERAVALAQRQHDALGCLALDLDLFKSINDRFGHAAGDRVLIEVIARCSEELRETDILGRTGGEEFVILLPGTSAAAALEVAERLRAGVASLSFTFGMIPVQVSVSIGVASLGPDTREFTDLMGQADGALYEAKRSGRDRCVAWKSTRTPPSRRRVLKAGQIVFNGGNSTVDCTVRGLADDGAELHVFSTVGVPRRFKLTVKADDLVKQCRVIAQSDKHLEVEFAELEGR